MTFGACAVGVALLVAVCSSGGGNNALTVSDIVHATSTASTARMSYQLTATDASVVGTGDADFTNGYRLEEKVTDSGVERHGVTVDVMRSRVGCSCGACSPLGGAMSPTPPRPGNRSGSIRRPYLVQSVHP